MYYVKDKQINNFHVIVRKYYVKDEEIPRTYVGVEVKVPLGDTAQNSMFSPTKRLRKPELKH